MVEQSAVILHNLVLEMNKQDLTNMTARLDSGGAMMGGVVRPGQSLAMLRLGPGDDYHYLMAAGSNTNARIAFRVKDASGKVVREARTEDASDRIYTTVRESHRSAANWTYEAVNMAKSGDPIVVTMMVTRSGSKGQPLIVGDFYKAMVALSTQVKGMTDENWGLMPGQSSVVGGVVAARSDLTMGPFNMAQDTFVLASSDGKCSDWELFLLRASNGAVLEKDTDTGDQPFGLVSGQNALNIKLQNTSESNSFGCYVVMRTP